MASRCDGFLPVSIQLAIVQLLLYACALALSSSQSGIFFSTGDIVCFNISLANTQTERRLLFGCCCCVKNFLNWTPTPFLFPVGLLTVPFYLVIIIYFPGIYTFFFSFCGLIIKETFKNFSLFFSTWDCSVTNDRGLQNGRGSRNSTVAIFISLAV